MSSGKELNEPVCDLSLDLDNKWAYLKTHGDEAWKSFPSYLDEVVPKFLALLREHDLKVTIMVVGQDACLARNRDALRLIVEDHHELGNHSFHHEPWMGRYTAAQVTEELDRAHAVISEIAENQLVGFRGPGYCLSTAMVDWLVINRYLYDGSTFPTFLGPAARSYYFLRSKFTAAERQDRSQLFGSFADGFRSIKPYRWQSEYGELIEFPVTTMPILRAPFHFSYLHYLSQVSSNLAMAYLRWSLLLCRVTRTSPSILMHPLDFLGGDEVAQLDFFPGMRLSGSNKRSFMARALDCLTQRFQFVTMRERAEHLLAAGATRMACKSTRQLN